MSNSRNMHFKITISFTLEKVTFQICTREQICMKVIRYSSYNSNTFFGVYIYSHTSGKNGSNCNYHFTHYGLGKYPLSITVHFASRLKLN